MIESYPPTARPPAEAPELTARNAHAATTPLDAALRALIADTALAGAFAATTGAALTDVVVDWPRRVVRDDLARWLRGGDALIELTRTPAREPLELGVVLHAESATRLVERILGGSASSAVPSAIGAPSEAECGVLAYAAARLCAAHPSAFVVRDVRAAPPPHTLPEALVLWPLSLRSAFASLEGLLLLSPALAASTPTCHAIELLLRDSLEDDAPLTPGDVLTSDRWTLTDTTEGLAGPVNVRVAGTATELSAQLARGALTATGPAPTPRPDEVTLVLATRALSFSDLASLASGSSCGVAVGAQPARLCRGSSLLAEGELVVHRGALGLRVTAT